MEEKKVYKYQKVVLKKCSKKFNLPYNYIRMMEENWNYELSLGKNYTNGNLFTMVNAKVTDNIIYINIEQTNYSHYLYSRKKAINKYSCRSMAGNVLLVTKDDFFVLGKMNSSTSLANRIKFIGGSIDEIDINKDNEVDMIKCISRETMEETGLNINDKLQVKEFCPIALLTREKLSFLNVLYLVKLNISKRDLENRFNIFQNNLKIAKKESELSELVYVENEYSTIHEFFNDDGYIFIDYMKDFFEAYYNKMSFGDFEDYVYNNLDICN